MHTMETRERQARRFREQMPRFGDDRLRGQERARGRRPADTLVDCGAIYPGGVKMAMPSASPRQSEGHSRRDDF